LIARHFLSGIPGKEITKDVEDLILKEKILGFTLFKRNFDTLEELISLSSELHSLAKQAGYTLALAVDHEGGRRVFRLPQPFTPVCPMRDLGDDFEKNNDATKAFKIGQILASEVKAVGFNVIFAPVTDIDLNENNPIIGDRSFSSHAEIVYLLARQVIRGVLSEGIVPCLKHFPGHGATSQDSHEELPTDNRSIDELKKFDLVPYQKIIAENLAPTIMTAHVVFPKIDKEPATISEYFINQLLRNELHYQGLLFSDDLLMKAISQNYNLKDVALKFFNNGGDVALICNQPDYLIEIIKELKNSK